MIFIFAIENDSLILHLSKGFLRETIASCGLAHGLLGLGVKNLKIITAGPRVVYAFRSGIQIFFIDLLVPCKIAQHFLVVGDKFANFLFNLLKR